MRLAKNIINILNLDEEDIKTASDEEVLIFSKNKECNVVELINAIKNPLKKIVDEVTKEQRKGLYVYIIQKESIVDYDKLKEKALFAEKLKSGTEAIVIAHDDIVDDEYLFREVSRYGIDKTTNVISNYHMQSYRKTDALFKTSETILTYDLSDKVYFSIDSKKCIENPGHIFDVLKIKLKNRGA